MILVVDDEHLLSFSLMMLLEDAGYEVDVAENGALALAAMRLRLPDLVITDFVMPVMTGLELAESIRADETLGHLPLILVSGEQAGIGRGRPDLFQAVFDKPYIGGHLLEAVALQIVPRGAGA
jgi:CheY-like chemotaxis protein